MHSTQPEIAALQISVLYSQVLFCEEFANVQIDNSVVSAQRPTKECMLKMTRMQVIFCFGSHLIYLVSVISCYTTHHLKGMPYHKFHLHAAQPMTLLSTSSQSNLSIKDNNTPAPSTHGKPIAQNLQERTLPRSPLLRDLLHVIINYIALLFG